MRTNLILKIASWVLSACLCLPAFAQMALDPEPMNGQSKSFSYKAAESKFYVKVYGFYALLTPGGFSGQGTPFSVVPSDNSITRFGTTTTYSGYTTKNPFGSGLRAGAGIGYVINDFINIGVDGEYVLGNVATENYATIVRNSFDKNAPPEPVLSNQIILTGWSTSFLILLSKPFPKRNITFITVLAFLLAYLFNWILPPP